MWLRSFFFCLSLSLTAGPGAGQLVVPRLLRQFEGKPGLTLTLTDIIQDQRGVLWAASTNGIVRFDGRQFRVFHDPLLKEGDFYYQVVPAPDGRIWLKMGSGHSLSYLDPVKASIVRVPDTTRLVRDYLASYGSHYVFVDADGTLWIGLKNHGLLEVDSHTFAVKSIIDEGLDVRGIAQDRQGIIYFTSSNRGFYRYNPRTSSITRYQHNEQETTSLSNDATFGVLARPDGSLLVGLTNEVTIYSPTNEQFTPIGLHTHFPLTPDARFQSAVVRFRLDNQGNAYFITDEGIFRYTVAGALQQLGLHAPTHYVNSVYVDSRNRLWVNSTTQLYQYALSPDRVYPALLFPRLLINGTPLKDNTNATQNLTYDAHGHPTLTVRENDPFTLQFTLQAQYKPGTIRWRLQGYDLGWASVQHSTGEASYQLSAGTYTLAVVRGNSAGVWETTPATLTIVVVAPFWKTPLFLGVVLLTVAALGFYFIRLYYRRRKLTRLLAHQQQEATNQRQLNELKTRFFNNVTHEFRTPLTIILNAAEQLSTRTAHSEQSPAIILIQRQATQLLRLITETLDIARLEAGQLEAHPQRGNPVWFVEQIVAQFAGLAEQREIILTYNAHPATNLVASPDEDFHWFDGEKWEKIVYNLLSNALKFTPPGGQVQVTGLVSTTSQFTLQVSDTGIGIPADQLDRIFDRFHQLDAQSTRAYAGTGLGLALVWELTQWLGGQVRVTSKVGQGSTFTTELPLTAADQAPPALASAPAVNDQPVGNLAYTVVSSHSDLFNQPASLRAPDKPLILVIEDNDDLRTQVVDYLTSDYQLLTAVDGGDGWRQALAQVPDLIVSDVMMPELNGYQLLDRLKNDERTSHIPVILLTARSASESRMQGLHAGADEYLVKPFSLLELVLRIRNSLRTRQNWQKRFSPSPHSALLTPSVDLSDEREARFLNRLRQTILDNLMTESIDVDWLAAQARMSRTQLNRKLSALTNLSPNRFIQQIRVARAAELLQAGELNVAQVAYQVGFSSPSYFAKVFQAHYGYAPTHLRA
ncbi:hybrid sensor histidine kinase/response regulator transcription factor [Spirosoma lituiforme]